MIHYTCDCCKRIIDPADDERFVVKIEVYAALDSAENALDDDRDHLEEIHDMLERLDGGEEVQEDDGCQAMRYDLCPECRGRFLKNPLGREAAKKMYFSQN